MIGIITFHCQYNYGSALQAYALQTYLKKFGYDVVILNYYYEKDMKTYNIRWYSKQPKVILFDLVTYPMCKARKKAYKKFQRLFLKLTPLTKDWKKLGTISKDCDTLICGSDQIWNFQLTDGVHPAYFLMFALPYQNRIAYAPSVAVQNIPQYLRNDLKKTLSKFKYISVREKINAEELSLITGKKVECVLDPTFLLKVNDYEELLKGYHIDLPHKYIFFYCLHHVNFSFLKIFAEKYAKDYNLEIVYFNKYNIHEKNYSINIFKEDPRAFIYAIKNSEFIISDSFHSTIFSILYHKSFAVYVMSDSKARLNTLMDKLEIGNRYILEDGTADLQDIDYSVVDRKLSIEREASISFLKKALSGN